MALNRSRSRRDPRLWTRPSLDTGAPGTLGGARRSRHARSDDALRGLEALITFGDRHGYDGLERLVVVYADAASADPATDAGRHVTALARLQATLHFGGPPAPNLRAPVGESDSRQVRAVRGDAMRRLVETLAYAPLEGLRRRRLHDWLDDPVTEDRLCELEPRRDPFGRVAEQERERVCEALRDADPAPGQPELLDPFTALGCLAEESTTLAVGELERIFQQCVEDSQSGDGRPSAADWDFFEDGVHGNPWKHENRRYPLQVHQEMQKHGVEERGEEVWLLSTLISNDQAWTASPARPSARRYPRAPSACSEASDFRSERP